MMNAPEPAIILRTAPSGESFLKLDILTPQHGTFLCLKRISKKNTSASRPDLFDTAEIILESSRQGTIQFVKDYRVLNHRAGIGLSYNTLLYASDFCALIALNGPHMAEPEGLFELTELILNAFNQKKVPQIIFLKAIYLLLKDEGYPVRESWWPNLAQNEKSSAKRILNQPSPVKLTQHEIEICEKLTESICRWLRQETDLFLPDRLQN